MASSLFSTFSVMEAELLGRANLGMGGLKTEGIDIARFSVLDPQQGLPGSATSPREGLCSSFEELCRRRILMLYDDIRREDRIALDDGFLEGVGFEDAAERSEIRTELQHTTCRMIWRRLAKSANARESRMTYDEWLATGEPFGEVPEDEEES
jgi:hypothetical protein